MRKSYILYADDDIEDHELMEMVINPYPEFQLISFYSGIALLNHLQKIKKEEVCIILLDINMPELTGLDTLRIIREKTELTNLPVVMFTTSNTAADKHVARSMNAEVLTKPYTSVQVEQVKQHIVKRCYEYLNAS